MSNIDTSPEAVAARVHHMRDSNHSPRWADANLIADLAADRDRLAAENARMREALETAKVTHGYWADCICRRPKKDSNTVFVDARDWSAYQGHSVESIAKIDAALAKAEA